MATHRHHHRRRHDASGSGRSTADRVLLGAVDTALAGTIFVVPFLMGGRQALGQFALVVFAAVAAVAWAIRLAMGSPRQWRVTWAEGLLLGGAALLVVQFLPLPPEVLAHLTPRQATLLPVWSGSSPDGLGAWSTVSLTPAATRNDLAIFLAYAMLFGVATQRFRSLGDVERLLGWCAIAAMAMALFGIVQYVTSNDKFFWFYEHPYSTTSDAAKGSFTNRNHFAHFLALGIGPLVWSLQRALARHPSENDTASRFALSDRRSASAHDGVGPILLTLGLGVVLLGVLLSLSRGGAIAMLAATAVVVLAGWRSGALGRRFILGVAGAGLVIGLALSIYGYDRVSTRMDTLAAGSLENLDQNRGRREIWETVVHALPDFLPCGAGAGSHQQIVPVYQERLGDFCYSHAENGYLQVLLELGVPGAVLVGAGLALCGFWSIATLLRTESRRMAMAGGALAAGLAASAVHSAVDFVWYVPGCMAIVALLAAGACRLWQLQREEPAAQPRLSAGTAWAMGLLVLAVGAWMVADRFGAVPAEPHWDAYRLLAAARDAQNVPADDAGDSEAAAPPTPAERSQDAQVAAWRVIEHLRTVVAWQPDHSEAHLRLAQAYAHLFGLIQENSPNAMSVRSLRETIAQSHFASKEAMDDWLRRAVGEHRNLLDLSRWHARRAVKLCPLHGEAYLLLADLCFLDGRGDSAKADLVAQAVRVRPREGRVLFAAGGEAWLAGNFPQWFQCWRDAYHADPALQEQVTAVFTGRCPPEDISTEIDYFIQSFGPDLQGVRLLHKRYVDLGYASDARLAPLRKYFVGLAEADAAQRTGSQAAMAWLEIQELYGHLGDRAKSLECARKAYRYAQTNYRVRFRLVECLLAVNEFAEAEQHLRWCTSRRPRDARLADLLRWTVDQRITREACVAAEAYELRR